MNDLLFANNLTEESLKFLIASGADINTKNSEGKTPLNCACYNDKFNIVKILIENGADINTKNSESKTPLNYACYNKK